MNAIHTDNAPAAIGPYSQAIEVNGFVFASGQIPIDPATGASTIPATTPTPTFLQLNLTSDIRH